jgi:hypothetical protein
MQREISEHSLHWFSKRSCRYKRAGQQSTTFKLKLSCAHAPAGTKSAVKIGNGLEPIRVGSKFETLREMLGLKLPMT